MSISRTSALLAALAVGTALTATACGSDSGSDPGSGGSSGGIGGDYVADDLPDPPFPEGSGPVRLTLRDGTIAFTASCNHFSGTATWDDGVLRTSQLGGTEIGCDEERAAQDEWLVRFFSSGPELRLDGTDLRVGSGADAIWFVPADEVQDPSAEPGDAEDLVGPTWALTQIGEVDGDSTGMMVVPDSVTSTLVLTDGGEVQVQYGCNSGGGTYRLSGDQIRFAHMMSTMMACQDVRGEVESDVQQVLMDDQPVSWAISGDELRLTTADGKHELVYRR
ncbi:META domain-containing protein [Nocardioides taihuensis]|uniref:META domain-containing protein n=1 Tax=Nocardioides taihuensis TaxID=1835606 RepID=A0ABW0BFQ1_9ACTN